MCGVAGILDYNPGRNDPANRYALGRMLAAMSHRGPDDQGDEMFISDRSSLYLGHRRLSIIDLSSRGHQPMANDDKSVWISTNGELYNFKELRSQLSHKFTFKSDTDTEVILRAYEAWGFECLNKFRGMFAFCIFDPSKKILFLARDHLGIKPLYYASNAGTFLFASEIRSLLASNILSAKIDPLGIYNYLSFGRSQSPHTIMSGIHEIKPAHYFVVDTDTGNISEHRYWNPVSIASSNTLDIKTQLSNILGESIGLQMISDVPLGAFLSGGIDSSAITGLSSQFANLKTLSLVFDEKEYDESEFSRIVAKHFSTDHHEMHLSEGDLLRALPEVIIAMDQPTIDGINTYLISRAAKQTGLKVALSGLGGDELFGGYDSFRSLPDLIRLNRWLRALPISAQRFAGNLVGILGDSDRNVKLSHLLSGKIQELHPYFIFRALFCYDQLNELIADSGAFAIGNQYLLDNSIASLKTISHLDVTEQISYLELTQYTSNMLLRDTDVMSMAHALEVRVPLLDHKLVELMFSIPGHLKIDPNVQKRLLVESVPGGLPDKAAIRKKMGFTLPFETWMRTTLKSEMENVLFTPVSSLSGIISEAGVRKVWKDFCGQKTTWARPWSLYILKKWAERNV